MDATRPLFATSGVARVHFRSPETGLDGPCVICCTSENIAVNAGTFLLPDSGSKLLEKIVGWQSDDQRTTDKPVKVLLKLDQRQKSAMLLPVCQQCTSLLTRIDNLETQRMKLLKEFWEVLDGSADESVVGNNQLEPISPADSPGIGGESDDFSFPTSVEVRRVNTHSRLQPVVSLSRLSRGTKDEISRRPRAASRRKPTSTTRFVRESRSPRIVPDQPRTPSRPPNLVPLFKEDPCNVSVPEAARNSVPESPRTPSGRTRRASLKRQSSSPANGVPKLSPKKFKTIMGCDQWLDLSSCRMCLKSHSDPEAFTRHLSSCIADHPEEHPFVCHFCLRGFREVRSYVGHVLYEESHLSSKCGFRCFCGIDFKSPRLLDAHFRDEHAQTNNVVGEEEELPSPMPFSCPECSNKGFASFEDFVRHRQGKTPEHFSTTMNTKVIELKCRLCPQDAAFETDEEANLRNHCLAQHGCEPSFECPSTCHKGSPVFNNLSALYAHCMSDFGVDTRCPVCEESTGDRKALVIHAKAHHELVIKVKRSKSSASEGEQVQVVTVKKERLSEDQNDSSSAGNENKKKEEPKSSGDKSPTKKKRVRTCKKSFLKCDYCEKMVERSRMHRHVEVVHMNIRDFPCTICEETLTSKDMLARHLVNVHHEPGRFECEDCKRQFATRSQYTTHRTTHERELCPVCGKAISGGKAVLRRHIAKTHERRHEFKCVQCDSIFRDLSNKKRHEARVHGINIQQFMFPCPVCGKVYSQSTKTRTHCLKKHNMEYEVRKMYPCPICGQKFINNRLVKHIAEHRAKGEGAEVDSTASESRSPVPDQLTKADVGENSSSP